VILRRRVIDLELTKINMKKLQTVITFDRQVGWRGVKNESCSKRGNGDWGPSKFQKFTVYYFFFFGGMM